VEQLEMFKIEPVKKIRRMCSRCVYRVDHYHTPNVKLCAKQDSCNVKTTKTPCRFFVEKGE